MCKNKLLFFFCVYTSVVYLFVIMILQMVSFVHIHFVIVIFLNSEQLIL